jgi:Ca-activated chloride channel family protein
MAQLGRGEVEYVGLQDDGSAAARRFWERVRDPLLTDLEIDWGGMAVTDVYPRRIPDLFSAKPVIVTGRYTGPMRGRVQLRGKTGAHPVTREIAVDLAAGARHDALASMWARQRVSDLMAQDLAGLHRGTMRPELQQQITDTGIEYGLATQFTSFIAVEERTVTVGGKAKRVEVPVELPEGMSYKGIGMARAAPARVFAAGGLAVGYGGGGGTGSGAMGFPSAPPPPPPLPAAMGLGRVVATGTMKLAPELTRLAQTSDETVDVQVLLRDASQTTLDQLRAVGLVITKPPGKDLQVAGHVTADKLQALAAIDAVRYVVKRVTPPPSTRR